MCLLMKLALSEYRYSAGSAIPFGVIIAEMRGGEEGGEVGGGD